VDSLASFLWPLQPRASRDEFLDDLSDLDEWGAIHLK
jgi:hypothetical protein